ncbi:MAG TPA: serine/threonine protein kinase, partial [Candidatus Hydrogenedentes bacterium]|nr:serine/threonine protein kinase [Candidatus Hydrogenedentota bacterium]
TGSGGMGVVYRAVDVTLGRTVALKILRNEFRAQSQIIARFKQEAKAFAQLDHPNIVRVYSVGTVGRIPYIAMEFIEGVSLSDMLTAKGPMPWREALEIGAQVAAALACAHDALIIHRDIKPANIIIDKTGKAHVTDFGIAKILNASSQLTQDGTRLGTPQYMCPERCRNKEVSPASDIYSLGVLLFQCISGRLPFEAANPVELVQKIAHMAPARLRTYAPDAPDSVERLIAHMIEKNPLDRPKNARVLQHAIERVLQGLPLDEQADQMSTAIAAFRSSLPRTPAHALRRETTTEVRPKTRILDRLCRGWFRLGKTARIAFAGVALLLAVASAAMLLKPVAERMIAARSGIFPALTGPQDASRWFHAPPVARFKKETAAVMVAHFSLFDFEVAGIHWAGGFADAVVEFTGLPNTPRQGQRMLTVANPSVQDAAIVLPPLPDGHAASFRLLAGGAADSGEPGAYLATGTRTVFLGLTSDAVCTIADFPATGLAALPDGGDIMLVRRIDASRWAIETAALEGISKNTELAAHATPIHHVALRAEGGAVAYLCGASHGRNELWLGEIQGMRMESRRLLDGDIRIAQSPFHPDGQSLLCAVESGDGTRMIRQISLADGTVIADLGPGEEAAWRPQGDYCVTLAPDHANRLQVWAIDAAPPHSRMQLTFLDSGVKPGLILSEEGHYALVPAPRSPDVAMVRLGALRF